MSLFQNMNLFLPIGDTKQQRRKDAESEADQQMDLLTQATPITDGGALTDILTTHQRFDILSTLCNRRPPRKAIVIEGTDNRLVNDRIFSPL